MSDDLESVLAGLLGNRATTPRLVVAPERHIDALADQIDELVAERGAAACVRLVRGKRCATKELTLHEFAAALRFPWYFGNNWDALDECLRDIAESRSPRVLLIVTEMPELLSGDKRSREILLETLRSAIEAGLPVLFQSSDERGERVLLEHGINIESAAL